MIYETAYDIETDTGVIYVPEFECRIEASLCWNNGEPYAVIDDIEVRDWSTDRPSYVSLIGLGVDDLCARWLADKITCAAEKDDDLLAALCEDEGIYYAGLGSNDPNGHWEFAR